MLEIDIYLYASDLEEAYTTLKTVPGSVVLGGCGYLRLGDRKISTAIDLTRLDLACITETDTAIEIGAMTSLRDVEVNSVIRKLWGGILAESVRDIVGVQLRKCVTIGGSVAGRFPFSDPLTALMALETKLVFFHQGMISPEDYLAGKGVRDVLEKVIIVKDGRQAAFGSIRKSKTDYAVLNVAVSKQADNYRIIVGARPGRAVQADKAAQFLSQNGLDPETAAEAGRLAAVTVQFGDNPRGSAAYRKAVCPILIERALAEVMHAA